MAKNTCTIGLDCGDSCIDPNKQCTGVSSSLASSVLNKASALLSSPNTLSFSTSEIELGKDYKPIARTPPDSEFLSLYNEWKAQQTDKLVGNRAKAINPNAPPPTEKQAEALAEYTGSEYLNTNSFLRKGEESIQAVDSAYQSISKADVIKNTKEFIMNITACLDAMPNYTEGRIWRGTALRNEVFNKMEVGGAFMDKAFLSTSTSEQKAGHFKYTEAINSSEHTRVLFEIRSTKGKLISKASLFEGEKEVLVKPSTEFRIVSIQDAEESSKKTGPLKYKKVILEDV